MELDRRTIGLTTTTYTIAIIANFGFPKHLPVGASIKWANSLKGRDKQKDLRQQTLTRWRYKKKKKILTTVRFELTPFRTAILRLRPEHSALDRSAKLPGDDLMIVEAQTP